MVVLYILCLFNHLKNKMNFKDYFFIPFTDQGMTTHGGDCFMTV